MGSAKRGKTGKIPGLIIGSAGKLKLKSPPMEWDPARKETHGLYVRLIRAGGDVTAAARQWKTENKGKESFSHDAYRQRFWRGLGKKKIESVRDTLQLNAVLGLLDKYDWNQSAAARDLGVRREVLGIFIRKLQKKKSFLRRIKTREEGVRQRLNERRKRVKFLISRKLYGEWRKHLDMKDLDLVSLYDLRKHLKPGATEHDLSKVLDIVRTEKAKKEPKMMRQQRKQKLEYIEKGPWSRWWSRNMRPEDVDLLTLDEVHAHLGSNSDIDDVNTVNITIAVRKLQ